MVPQSIPEHMELWLGKIEQGWQADQPKNAVSIARFSNQPVEGMCTYATLGLSHHSLAMGEDRYVRQELVFTTFSGVPSDDIVSFLMNFSDFMLSHHQALLKGQAVGLKAPIVAFSEMNAIYATGPVMFDDDFATFEKTSPSTVLVWVIPIYENEAKLIQEHGWEPFEDTLEELDPDLWDMNRPPITSLLVNEQCDDCKEKQ